MVTGRPFEMSNIRAGRQKPGLRPQHLQCVRAAVAICGAHVTGAGVGASRITFAPGRVRPGEYHFDIGTAGATALVLHTLYLPLSLCDAESVVVITGGTHVPFSPCYHYVESQWAVHARALGLRIRTRLLRAGFYPRGGGKIRARIGPVDELTPVSLDRRGLLRIVRGLSIACNLPEHVAERQKTQAERRLLKARVKHHVRIASMPAFGKGTVLFLQAEFERSKCCYFGLGALRKRAEKVADEAWKGLHAFLKTQAAIDEFLADQLLLPLALVDGRSTFTTCRLTEHVRTNADIIRRFLPARIEIEGQVGEEARVVVQGTGLGGGVRGPVCFPRP